MGLGEALLGHEVEEILGVRSSMEQAIGPRERELQFRIRLADVGGDELAQRDERGHAGVFHEVHGVGADDVDGELGVRGLVGLMDGIKWLIVGAEPLRGGDARVVEPLGIHHGEASAQGSGEHVVEAVSLRVVINGLEKQVAPGDVGEQ